MTALLVGSVLAVAGLVFVLWPLLKGGTARVVAPATPELPPDASALEALREIEFDQATGKLSAEDYAVLRASYTPRALAELDAREAAAKEAAQVAARSEGAGPGVATEPGDGAARTTEDADEVEALIARAKSRARSCPSCGPRPEADALFCSDCGRYLGSACLHCGARVESDRARFCTDCGGSLAA